MNVGNSKESCKSEEEGVLLVSDGMIKKIIFFLITVVIVQGGSFLYLVGVYAKQQDINTMEIDALKKASSSITELKSDVIHLTEIVQEFKKTVMEAFNKVGDNLQQVSNEQYIRTGTINRAERFMDEHIKYHAKIDRSK